MSVINEYIKLMKLNKQDVICCCVGKIKHVKNGVNILIDRYSAFTLNGLKFYDILDCMRAYSKKIYNRKGAFIMNIELLTANQEEGTQISYSDLYNGYSRGGVFKTHYEPLLEYCMEQGILKVKKYIIEKGIDIEEFYEIEDRKGRQHHRLIERLKDYHQESDVLVTPFIYLLEKLEPMFKVNDDLKEEILGHPSNLQVGYRFEGTNAKSRLYVTDSRIAINSTNDNIDNLIDTLCIDNISLFILEVGTGWHLKQDLHIYKIEKDTKTFDKLKTQLGDKIVAKIFEKQI